jgi:DNA-directed RNA polymerase subunit RPC12/RpoP
MKKVKCLNCDKEIEIDDDFDGAICEECVKMAKIKIGNLE